MSEPAYVTKLNAIANASRMNAADLLSFYDDHQLLEALQAIAGHRSFPPLWQFPLSFKLSQLIAPTLNAELLRRWEVRALEEENAREPPSA